MLQFIRRSAEKLELKKKKKYTDTPSGPRARISIRFDIVTINK